MSSVEVLSNLKELVVKEKERCKELSNYYPDFIFTLNDILLGIEELEKPKESRAMSSLFIFESIKELIKGEKERYLQLLKYKKYIRIQPILQEFISFLDNVLFCIEQLEKEGF